MAGTVGKTAVCYQGHQVAGEQILYSLSEIICFYELRKEDHVTELGTKYPRSNASKATSWRFGDLTPFSEGMWALDC